MPPLLHKTIRVVYRTLCVLVCLVLVLLTVVVVLVMYEETKRTSYLNRMLRETKVPEQLVTPGEHPLASLFMGLEDRICVLDAYAGNRGLDEMTAGQLKAIQDLELPGEDGMWYLVAFQGDDAVRLLLITIRQVELSSRSTCFHRHQPGVIQVTAHQHEHLPFRSVDFHIGDER